MEIPSSSSSHPPDEFDEDDDLDPDNLNKDKNLEMEDVEKSHKAKKSTSGPSSPTFNQGPQVGTAALERQVMEKEIPMTNEGDAIDTVDVAVKDSNNVDGGKGLDQEAQVEDNLGIGYDGDVTGGGFSNPTLHITSSHTNVDIDLPASTVDVLLL